VVLLVPRLQAQLAAAGAPLQTWSDRHFGGSPRSGIAGQVLWGCCSAPYGARVSVQPSVQHRSSPRKVEISAWSGLRCCRLA
jgi:hypothetical protein